MVTNTQTGSEACMTTWYKDYLSYMNLYNFGDEGKFVIINPLKY